MQYTKMRIPSTGYTHLNLSESYVRNVLGFTRLPLMESTGDISGSLAADILYEHFLFESFWGKAKDWLKGTYGDAKEKVMEPIEAIKKFGGDVKGMVAGLTVAMENEKMLKQVSAFVKRNAKTVGHAIVKKIIYIGNLLKKYNMPTFAKGMFKLAGKIDSFRVAVNKISGWKGMLACL